MPFVTAERLQELVASDFQKSDPNDLGASADTFRTAVVGAEDEIRGAMLSRGYSAAVILAWDRLENYHIVISKWVLCGLVKSIKSSYSPDELSYFKGHIEGLATVRVFVNKELIDPDRGAQEQPAGSVGYGMMSAWAEAQAEGGW